MIEFVEYADPSVAPFFVAKRDRSGEVRMVLDTRCVRRRFLPADRVGDGGWQRTEHCSD